MARGGHRARHISSIQVLDAILRQKTAQIGNPPEKFTWKPRNEGLDTDDFPFQTDKVMNSGEPAVNCPGCNQAAKKTDKAGHGRTMPRFNLITTRPISKKTSPPSVPPSADNSLYRVPFFFETPTKEKKTKTSLRQFQAPFDFRSNQNHRPY